MKTATQIIFKLASAAAIVLFLSNCASTVTTVDATADAIIDCSSLDWDSCAVATQCRHARDWVESTTGYEETFTCESKPPVFATVTSPAPRFATAR